MANSFNKFKILTCANSPIDLNNININRLLTTKPKMRNSLNQIFDYNINEPQLMKKNKNQRKSAFMISNNVSSVETSISSFLLDGANNIKKQLNNNSKSTKYFSEIGEQKQGQKPLVYYVPKNIENKLIFDIVFGHFYFLSKNYNDIKKIEKFIFDLQIKFNKTILNLYNRDNNDFNDNSELSQDELLNVVGGSWGFCVIIGGSDGGAADASWCGAGACYYVGLGFAFLDPDRDVRDGRVQ